MTKNTVATPLITKNNFDIVTTYCIIDDFFKFFDTGLKGRKPILGISEIVTIALIQQIYEIRCLQKLYYLLKDKYTCDFKLPCYKNFLISMNKASRYLMLFIFTVLNFRKSGKGGICFVDSTKIEVCKIYREKRHKTMKALATKHKSTTGWFYGLRLHLICDKDGNLVKIRFATATYSEREVLDDFLNKMNNWKVGADAGYVDKELEMRATVNNNILITAKRKNMKTIHTIWENICLNMRGRVETVFDVLKERYGLVTSLPRSVNGYFAHYIRCLFCYMVLG
jgi:hypothetical protein